MKRHIARALACTVLLLGVAACGPGKLEDSSPEVTRWALFGSELAGHWKEAEMLHSGGIRSEEDGYLLKAGAPMTGIVFPTWQQDGLPLTSYRITYEAMRVSGHDFFGSLTFPVGSAGRCVTFVL